MIHTIDFHISALDSMKKYPSALYYKGNLELLNKKKIGVVGGRKATKYAKELTHKIVSGLSDDNNVIVSGGAIGIDTIAHKAAGLENTIMVAGTGLDSRYPAINKSMIETIEQKGLILSQFAPNTPSYPRNFAIRNEITVALSNILLVSYADLKSGTMRSIEYALKMNKEIYVLPHRIGESEGTNQLLAQNKAKAIYDIDGFIAQFSNKQNTQTKLDEFSLYCKNNPEYNDAVTLYGQKVFEAELLGEIEIKNGKIFPL
jgi:DNA processing protein